jgi:HAD superfamily hydrolase (TIGR01549 family)
MALALDFDRTIAETFEEAFGARNVVTAYEYAIEDVFGEEGVVMYRSQGGLRNRAPMEIVMELGVPKDRLIEMTNRMVERKLAYLLPAIGSKMESGELWPPLTKGFAEFWSATDELRAHGRLLIAVVSNGHDAFINKAFDVHKLSRPDALVTDDDVRGLSDVEPSRKSKPDPLILEIAAEKLGIDKFDAYIGDNMVSDGGMARRAGIAFGHFDNHGDKDFEHLHGGFRFRDWNVLLSRLSELSTA